MISRRVVLPEATTQDELDALIDDLNADEAVDGMLVQLPVPDQLSEVAIANRIHPDKDVDGFSPINLGRLIRGEPGSVPCTPAGIMWLLDRAGVELEGAEAVVVGRSLIVGKPMALLLTSRSATVTVAHSRTRDLPGPLPAGRRARGRGRAARDDPRRLDQAGRGRHRRRHQPHRRRAASATSPGDEAARGRRLAHAGPGRRRPHDHRLPAGQHPRRRPATGGRLTEPRRRRPYEDRHLRLHRRPRPRPRHQLRRRGPRDRRGIAKPGARRRRPPRACRGAAGGHFTPRENVAAAEEGELAVVSIPWEGIDATIPPMADALAGKVVVSVVNALRFGKSGAIAEQDLPGGSAAHRIQELAPEAKVVVAYNNLPAAGLQARHHLDADVLVCGKSREAREAVIELTKAIPGTRALDAGPARQRPHPRGDDGHHHQPQPALRRRGAACRSPGSRTPRSARPSRRPARRAPGRSSAGRASSSRRRSRTSASRAATRPPSSGAGAAAPPWRASQREKPAAISSACSSSPPKRRAACSTVAPASTSGRHLGVEGGGVAPAGRAARRSAPRLRLGGGRLGRAPGLARLAGAGVVGRGGRRHRAVHLVGDAPEGGGARRRPSPRPSAPPPARRPGLRRSRPSPRLPSRQGSGYPRLTTRARRPPSPTGGRGGRSGGGPAGRPR